MAAESPSPHPITSSELDAIFHEVVKSDAPGCVVAIRQQGGAVITRTYGLASLEYNVAIAEETIFDCGSISKQFTGFLLALLIADGKVALDDDVRKYIPELPSFGSRITLGHLVYHTSGLRDYGDIFSSSGIKEDDPITTKAALAALFKQRELNFAPGSQYSYTNAEYLLLKEIISKVSGKPMKDVAQERIFGPLGMRHTHFQEHHSHVVKNRAWGYKPDGQQGWLDSVPVADIYGPSSLFTTIGDLLLWQQNLVDGKIGGPEIVSLIQTAGKLADGTSTNYGFGLNLSTVHGRRAVGHAGDNEGFRSVLTFLPEDEFAVAILSNRTDLDPSKLAAKIMDLRFGATEPPAPTPNASAGPSEPVETLKTYAGIFLNPLTYETRRVEFRDGKLIYARAGGLPMTQIGPRRFLLATTGGEVEFVRKEGHERMLVKPAGQPAISYDKQEPFAPNSKQLEEYAGRYYSDELEVTHVISALKDGLSVKLPNSEPFTVTPSYRDAFSDPSFSVRFTRAANGKIDGFRMNNGRVRNLRFVLVHEKSK